MTNNYQILIMDQMKFRSAHNFVRFIIENKQAFIVKITVETCQLTRITLTNFCSEKIVFVKCDQFIWEV